MLKATGTLAVLVFALTAQGADWETFGDWQVKPLHDQMDTVTHVVLLTPFVDDKGKPDLRMGFDLFGGRLLTLSTSVGFIGDNYWPECDFNMSTVSVDGGKAVRLTPNDEAGECSRAATSGGAIKQMLSGRTAKVRLGYNNGRISLNGFKQAWARAKALSKR
jgi:hypothetical protein